MVQPAPARQAAASTNIQKAARQPSFGGNKGAFRLTLTGNKPQRRLSAALTDRRRQKRGSTAQQAPIDDCSVKQAFV